MTIDGAEDLVFGSAGPIYRRAAEKGTGSEMAEGVRFELTRERNPLPVFKTGALNHSATLPEL